MLIKRTTCGLFVAALSAILGVNQALAGDWTIANAAGSPYSIAGQIGAGANLAAGDGIIVTSAADLAIEIDSAAVPALGDAGQAAITNLRVSNSSGTVTLLNGAALGGTVTVNGTGGTLKILEAGAIADINLTSNATPDVDNSVTVTSLDLTSDATADVATGRTLTVSNGLGVAARSLTLTGTGTISRVDVTTGTITDNGGTTIADLRALPGAGNTFTFGGTGNATVTSLAGALTGHGNVFKKTGNGTLTITDGLSGVLDNANGVLIDIDGGTLVVGTSGGGDTARDIIFDNNKDEITVANGATLTTYGSITVADMPAPANVNLDAAAGSTVNLSSPDANETDTDGTTPEPVTEDVVGDDGSVSLGND